MNYLRLSIMLLGVGLFIGCSSIGIVDNIIPNIENKQDTSQNSINKDEGIIIEEGDQNLIVPSQSNLSKSKVTKSSNKTPIKIIPENKVQPVKISIEKPYSIIINIYNAVVLWGWILIVIWILCRLDFLKR